MPIGTTLAQLSYRCLYRAAAACRIVGAYPPSCCQTGEALCTLLRDRAVSPSNNVPENKKVYVLGMDCGRLASPS